MQCLTLFLVVMQINNIKQSQCNHIYWDSRFNCYNLSTFLHSLSILTNFMTDRGQTRSWQQLTTQWTFDLSSQDSSLTIYLTIVCVVECNMSVTQWRYFSTSLHSKDRSLSEVGYFVAIQFLPYCTQNTFDYISEGVKNTIIEKFLWRVDFIIIWVFMWRNILFTFIWRYSTNLQDSITFSESI